MWRLPSSPPAGRSTRPTGRPNHSHRHELLKRFRDLLKENRQKLVDIARHEAGSALGAAFGAQVDGALEGANVLIDIFPNIQWEVDRGTRRQYGFDTARRVMREPIGVAAAITPWNVPLYVNLAKVVSGLLAGCTMILKPAPETPLAGAILGELAQQAGFPAGVFNVITSSDPAMAGEMLVTDPRVDLITFTGSTARRQAHHGKGRADAQASLPGARRQIGNHCPRRCAGFRRERHALDGLLSRRPGLRHRNAPAGTAQAL